MNFSKSIKVEILSQCGKQAVSNGVTLIKFTLISSVEIGVLIAFFHIFHSFSTSGISVRVIKLFVISFTQTLNILEIFIWEFFFNFQHKCSNIYDFPFKIHIYSKSQNKLNLFYLKFSYNRSTPPHFLRRFIFGKPFIKKLKWLVFFLFITHFLNKYFRLNTTTEKQNNIKLLFWHSGMSLLQL